MPPQAGTPDFEQRSSGCTLGSSQYEPRQPDRTLLYQTVQAELETFLARARDRGQPAPRFVEQELRAYLRCGIPAHGFLRFRCDEFRHERIVPFSCKRRGDFQ